MHWHDEFQRCIQCGYEDYDHPAPRRRYRSKGLSYVAKYSGEYPAFEGVEVFVRIEGGRMQHPNLEVTCPWCGVITNQTLSPKKTGRYRCITNHQIVIVNQKDGTIRWY